MPHIHEKIDFTVEVFIVHKNKVLLRMHDKYRVWLSVGGHIELDEDPNEAAIREVKEEVGLDIEIFDDLRPPIKARDDYKELIPPKFLCRHLITKLGHTHVTLTYFARSNSNTVIPEKETDVWKWYTLEELERDKKKFKEDIFLYAKTALTQLIS